MYDIGISEIKCLSKYVDKEGAYIKYEAEAAQSPSVCQNPLCPHRKNKLHKHTHNRNLIKDTRSEGKIVLIDLKIQYYKCVECLTLTPDRFSFFEKGSHITNRLKDEFVRRCIKGETFSYIANDYGVDHKTVAKAFHDYVKKNEQLLQNDYTPEVLGIDEAHIDDHYRLVLTDIKNQRFLDIKRDNKESTVKAYLRTLDGDVCKCVTMDFARVYSSAVKTILPSAIIVIDKFHVIQTLNRHLDNYRKTLQHKFSLEHGDIAGLKKAKHLFMANFDELNSNAVAIISQWCRLIPELYEAYMCKEVLRDIYGQAKDMAEAESKFNAWITAIPDCKDFNPAKRNMLQRKDHILNYWRVGVTNAYTESVNNLIKKIEKAGRGYKFDTLRERCLLEINAPKMSLSNPKDAIWIRKGDDTLYEQHNKLKYLLPCIDTKNTTADFTVTLNDCMNTYFTVSLTKQRDESSTKRIKTYAEKLSSILKKARQ